MYEHLLSPMKLGSLELPNRVVMAPMTRARAVGYHANGLMAEYYVQRASAGLLISEGTHVSEQAKGWVDAPGIYTAEDVECWKPVTKAVHDAKGRIFCQLWHCGRASHSSFRPDEADGRGVAPTAMKIEGHEIGTPLGKLPNEVPRELTTEEVDALPEQYRNAAEKAKEAGFDGVEIHSANGYLLDEFLQSKTNKRTDKYGGSFENRFRVIRAIIEAVLTVWPSDAVAIRFSPNGNFNDVGSEDFRESFLYYIKEVANYNLGYLHVMIGLTFGFHKLGEPLTLEEVRKVYSGVIMANCGYTGEQAEKDIAAGLADLVSFGRLYLANPDLVERFASNAELAPLADHTLWFAPGFGAKGYSDYPKLAAAK